ncbi:MAG: M23 family metallopeptidase, partial [Acidimicrobiales bacterium]
ELQQSGRYLDQIQFTYSELVDNLIAARRAYAKSLLYSYLQEVNVSIPGDLETQDGMDDAATDVYLEFVLTEKSDEMIESQKQLDSSDPQILRLADEQGEARLDLDDLRGLKVIAEKRFAESEVVVDGARALEYEWQFPVSGNEYNFVDSFLAPRYANGKYDHAHQGADIFASYGTPLVAVERGILFKVGIGRIGGIKLWVLGESGTAYYYAHMSAFAEISENGVLVEPGQIVGYVGDSGNARGTPPHVHFEVHPEAGRAVNPTSLLKYAQERDGNG